MLQDHISKELFVVVTKDGRRFVASSADETHELISELGQFVSCTRWLVLNGGCDDE